MKCDSTGEVPVTDFRTGSATLTFGPIPEVVVLDQIGDSTFLAGYDPACPPGAQAEWTNESGTWVLTVLANSEPNDAFGGQWGTFWIDGYETDPPMFGDGGSCALTIKEITAARLVGHAECRGQRWLNGYLAATDMDMAEPLPGLAPFDVSITFTAEP